MIGIALLAVLGILAVVSGMYWRKFKSGQIDSIAVLPLDMRSTDPEADYISDGIAESINNSLAQLPSLKVIPYSVALHYKGKAVDIQKTGDALQVQTLLTGRIAQHGDNLSIGVELDDVRNGKQVWGQQYSGKVADLLRVESDIAKEVSQRLRSNHSADRQKLALGSTENPDAYQAYLKGVHYTSKFTKDGFDKASITSIMPLPLILTMRWPTAPLLLITSIRPIGLLLRRSQHRRPKKPPKRRWNWTIATRKRMSCWLLNRNGTSGTGPARSASSNEPLNSIRIMARRSDTIHGSCRSWVAAMKQSP
jgi:TolB-like protein